MSRPDDRPFASAGAEERAVLGAILLDNRLLSEVESILSAEDFGEERHRLIFRAMRKLGHDGSPLEPITIGKALQERSLLDKVGGGTYISSLIDEIPRVESIAWYAQKVKAKARRRVQAQLLAKAYGAVTRERDDEEASRAIDLALRELNESIASRSSRMRPAGDIAIEVVEQLEERLNGTATMPIGTGIVGLDKLLFGLEPGTYVIAGRPSTGKTSLALDIATHIGRAKRRLHGSDRDNEVLFVSLDMSAEALGRRQLSRETGIRTSDIRNPVGMARDRHEALARAAVELSEAHITVCEEVGLTMDKLERVAVQFANQHPDLAAIVVDYAQLLVGDGPTRREQMIGISAGLKRIALLLRIPVIALLQVSRRADDRKDERPELSDLLESSQWEQDAKAVLFTWRPNRKMAIHYGEPEPAFVIVAKQQDGPIGDVSLCYWRHITSWSDVPEDELTKD